MKTETNKSIEPSRLCTRCKGAKVIHHGGFTALDGKVYPDRDDPCYACNGAGQFNKPDWHEIITLITKSGPNGKRSFRKSKPNFMNEYRNRNEGRAYFVWRMIRFHGGADVCMPVCADSAISGDPYWDELDKFASELAKRFYGTDMAAAYRWAGALGHNVSMPDGLPASAYSCGPVADEHKPESEVAEIC
jgi:hypothetical protein